MKCIKICSSFFVILLFIVACGAAEVEQEQDTSTQTTVGLQPGQYPPGLALETLSGEIFDESDLKGKKVIINFWATWCAPCREEMPDLVRLAREYKEDLVVLAVNLEEDPEDIKSFVEKYDMEFPILLDRTGELAYQYEVLAIPTSYFLHSNGTIAKKHTGLMTYEQMVQGYKHVK